MSSELLLKLNNVSVSYGGVHALQNVDVSLAAGEIVAVMGPNGAGKSTVMKALFGLAPFVQGRVLWHEQEITPVPHEMVRRGVVFVPQGRRIFPHLTVEENLEIGSSVVDSARSATRMKEIMDIFPVLEGKRNFKAGALSGGEQQMLAVGRGLMADPKVLLLDEPSLGLSPKLVKEMFKKIKEINERHRTAIMVVEHNIVSLLAIAHRAYVLDKGTVAFTGEAENLSRSSKLEDVFMGKVM